MLTLRLELRHCPTHDTNDHVLPRCAALGIEHCEKKAPKERARSPKASSRAGIPTGSRPHFGFATATGAAGTGVPPSLSSVRPTPAKLSARKFQAMFAPTSYMQPKLQPSLPAFAESSVCAAPTSALSILRDITGGAAAMKPPPVDRIPSPEVLALPLPLSPLDEQPCLERSSRRPSASRMVDQPASLSPPPLPPSRSAGHIRRHAGHNWGAQSFDFRCANRRETPPDHKIPHTSRDEAALSRSPGLI